MLAISGSVMAAIAVLLSAIFVFNVNRSLEGTGWAQHAYEVLGLLGDFEISSVEIMESLVALAADTETMASNLAINNPENQSRLPGQYS